MAARRCIRRPSPMPMLQAVVAKGMDHRHSLDVQPDADAFFNNIEQLLDWQRKPDKTNGEETDFGKPARPWPCWRAWTCNGDQLRC